MDDTAKGAGRRPAVVLGVSGSIAAYKAADIASGLIRAGYNVYPILTRGGAKFITPATLTALTGNPCPIDSFDEPFPDSIAHIRLAQSYNAIVIAPASLNVIGRLANGLADDMLTAVCMAATVPIIVAPAMNTHMWENPALQANVAVLRSRGYRFVEPISGRLACRTEGVGKLADVDDIIAAVRRFVEANPDLAGKNVLVTAGPTREPIDPVRYLTNRSSGKMGYSIAEAAAARGARVTLVTGPTALAAPAGIDVVRVETACEMLDAVLQHAPAAAIVVAAAAVADYRPASPANHKIKKDSFPEGVCAIECSPLGEGDHSAREDSHAAEIKLQRNPDIVAEVARRKPSGQVIVGFAAETDDVLAHAAAKLAAKGLDWIVANDVTAKGAGFESDTNVVTILGAAGARIDLPLLPKRTVADRVLDAALGKL